MKLYVYRIPVEGWIEIVAYEDTSIGVLMEAAKSDADYEGLSEMSLGHPQTIRQVVSSKDFPKGYSDNSIPWGDNEHTDETLGELLK